MKCQRCGQRDASVQLTRIDDSQGTVEDEHLCTDCAGPIEKAQELWRELRKAGSEPMSPDLIARLEQAQNEFAKIMAELGGPRFVARMRGELKRPPTTPPSEDSSENPS